jgi:hypothetical protein
VKSVTLMFPKKKRYSKYNNNQNEIQIKYQLSELRSQSKKYAGHAFRRRCMESRHRQSCQNPGSFKHFGFAIGSDQ